MRAEIICVGSELLLGDIADTNTQYLALRLSALGIDLYYSTSVGDNLGRLVDCLQRAFGRSDLILTSGGLGPTDDDLTREAIAALVGETPAVDDKLAAALRTFFEVRRMEMTDNNLKQAWLIPSAQPIANVRGTAPGWWVSSGGKTIVAMPGPPGELHEMWESEVEPRLGEGESVIRSRTLKLFNISESRVDVLLKRLTSAANPTVAVYAKQDGIHVRITAKAEDDEAALGAIQPIEAEARRLLGDCVWGTDGDTQESVAGSLLAASGLSLAVAEGVTCGQVAALLGSTQGSDAWFRGAIVLPGGRRFARDAEAIARTAAEQCGADLGLGVCGWPVPGAEPAMDELLIAAVRPQTGVTRTGEFRSRHHLVRTLGAYYALHVLRGALGSDLGSV
jgi:nicotinamide-nucleotide amidase